MIDIYVIDLKHDTLVTFKNVRSFFLSNRVKTNGINLYPFEGCLASFIEGNLKSPELSVF